MSDQFISAASLELAVEALRGTADTSGFKVWLTLKAMGLREGTAVEVRATEGNSARQLEELYSYPNATPDEKYFVPFGETKRYRTMKHDAWRSIIQTSVKEWKDGRRQADPRQFLGVSESETGAYLVATQPAYPSGLGLGKNGFATEEGVALRVPIRAWSAWFGRRTAVPASEPSPIDFLVAQMLHRLQISPEERMVVFADDDFAATFENQPIQDDVLNSLVMRSLGNESTPTIRHYRMTEAEYGRRLASIRTEVSGPRWLARSPVETLAELVAGGARAILLYGPPRTGKTRAVDALFPRSNGDRRTIQIHDGWGYERLMLGLKSDDKGGFTWAQGPLLQAIRSKQRAIVLEEANRTQLAQALGEVFSLLEPAYRGENHGVDLADGSKLSIDEGTIFFFTLNTLDKSTEEVDDALLGRIASIEFPPRVEDLHEILRGKGAAEEVRIAVAEFFAGVSEKYPLGHGYFSDLQRGMDIGTFYQVRIRPVLQKHFSYRNTELTEIDLLADKLLRGKAI